MPTIIAANHHDSQQATALEVDLAQLAQDMDRLHALAHGVADATLREHFARVEHTVNWRFDQLAYVLAAQDKVMVARC